MKITKFHIQNFQSHKDTTIDFTNGLNILVGSTNTGKSAVLRALRKLIRDEPSGKVFISKWATDMNLELQFEHRGNSYKIIRKLTQTKNLYYLDDEEFGGFGKTIPQEVQDALDTELVELENGDVIDLHFSDQHDLPFMVAKGSAGTRSKLLGKVAGLHVLDRAISRINSDIRAENSKYKHSIDTRDDLQAEVDDFPDLWQEHTLIERLNKQFTDLCTKREQLQRLTIASNELDYYTEAIDRIAHTDLSHIVVDLKSIQSKMKTRIRLNTLCKELSKLASEAARIKSANIDERLASCIEEHTTILNTLGICPTCKQSIDSQK